jgi:hypothetical protein
MATNCTKNEPTAAIGKVLQGQGVGTASNFSTATYPSTATGTGKILRADGTNWVATTATYPDTAGTSGNVLTSDGTNWNSSTPAGGAAIALFTSITNTAVINDSTTYFISCRQTLAVTDSANARFVIPFNTTLRALYGVIPLTGAGTSENCTFSARVNNTTDNVITSTLKLNTTSQNLAFTGLSIALSAGDYVSFKLVTPAFATNPTGFKISFTAICY